MPPKRKQRGSVFSKGLAIAPLKDGTLPWSWVGTEITDVVDITLEHLLSTCGLSERNCYPHCPNKYTFFKNVEMKGPSSSAEGEIEDDVIVISDDDAPPCTKKLCRANPNCLNYLGQEKWEEEEEARESFIASANLGKNPTLDSRDPDLPVGLKNLGATCYANASLQVWYRDLAFREGVYRCQPPDGTEDRFMESPIFQLQVTFAALQNGDQSVFNPAKLVESLQLRTSEQQDAQEFSKLFMSHLDAEFRKQSMPSVKHLVTNQFQGQQVYGTICHACRSRSERITDFLEIEINFDSNSRLEDRMATSLLPETLVDENRYSCSQCNELRDATRYTELRQLPHVLHFSLLRFVYDFSSMERKKSKHSISFPTILDMSQFLGNENDRSQAATSNGGHKSNIYELRGILLHKGASAYHGHYEAQVYDPELQSWFQFSDETVTRIKSLGDKIVEKRSEVNGRRYVDEKHKDQARRNRANARKRRRVCDSDEDAIECVSGCTNGQPSTPLRPNVMLPGTSSSAVASCEDSNTITSKDAYMLIYTKKELSEKVEESGAVASTRISTPCPPGWAADAVRLLNAAHEGACEIFESREKLAKKRFQDARKKVMDVYRTWNTLRPTMDSLIIGQEALEEWLSKASVETGLGPALIEQDTEDPELVGSSPQIQKVISNRDILCCHGKLDPNKARDMKRIAKKGYDEIVKNTYCLFDPTPTPSDVCEECVATIFRERLYQVQHPALVRDFDRISDIPEHCEGFWISKKWLKDWRLSMPRMHVPSQDDPPPDSCDFDKHVRCEHGGLTLNTTNRCKISEEAVKLLQVSFPTWNPTSSDAEICAVCDALIHISKEDKKEGRRRAEDEKAMLKHMYNSWAIFPLASEKTPCAVIPTPFYKCWKRWVDHPAENTRPDTVDNEPFFCEHRLLIFDPNCQTDVDSTVTVIRREEWDALQRLYSAGPLIDLEQQICDEEVNYGHSILVCSDCRLKRKTDWDNAEIIVRSCGSKTETSNVKVPSQRKPITTYSCNAGVRQSKRLRQIKEHGERRRFPVSKSTSLKEIKIMIQEQFKIPTICQRLFHNGAEMHDNEATVGHLQFLAGDILDLQEANEVIEIDSDSDDPPARKKRREEGQGFNGTLLSGMPSSREDTPILMPLGKVCSACTFSNTVDALSCTLCDTVFG